MAKKNSNIKYIIFDCDGVLVDSEEIACKVLSEMLKPYGCLIEPEELMSNYVGMKDLEIVRTLSEKYSLKLPDDFMDKYAQVLDAKLEKELKPIEGIEGVLKSITLPKALVSNSSVARIKISTKSAGLATYFEEKKIFSADTAQVTKPDPRIYQYALEKLGIEPKDAIVIEDSPTGVLAASKAGITVIGFTAAAHHQPNPEEKLKKNGATFVAQNSHDLYLLLKEICS